jgi:hypothetical protein
MNDIETAQRLREALDAVAGGVRTSPDAYERALAEWRRRERRRRITAVLLAAALVAGADGIGLWALNRTGNHGPVVFDAPPPAVVPPAR